MKRRLVACVLGSLSLAGCATSESREQLAHPIFGGQNPTCRETEGSNGDLVRICETERHVTVEKIDVASRSAEGPPLDFAPKPAPLAEGGVIEKLLAQSAAAKKGRLSGRPSEKIVLVCTI